MNSTSADSAGPVQLAVPGLAFTAAITGHRAIAQGNVDRLTKIVAGLLSDMSGALLDARSKSALDRDRPVDLRLLSALAQGADQIGAAAAARAEGERWSLEVILPYARDAYLAEMDAKAAPGGDKPSATARAFLAASPRPRTLELADWSPVPGATDKLQDHWRNRRYWLIGQMLARRADLLIAIWRGGPAEGLGGTADVVADAYRTGVPVLWVHPDTLEVRAVLATGEHHGGGLLALAEQLQLEPESTAPAQVRAAIDQAVEMVLVPAGKTRGGDADYDGLAAFAGLAPERCNEKVAPTTWWRFYDLFRWAMLLGTPDRPAPSFSLRVDHEREVWVARGDGDGFMDASDRRIGPFALASDLVATRLGHAYRSGYLMIIMLTTLAVILAALGLLLPKGAKPFLLIAELVALGAAFGLYRLSLRLCWHRRLMNARHVAESLRGVRILAWLGLSGRRQVSADSPWTAWYSNATAALPALPDTRIGPEEVAALAGRISESLKDQLDYHRINHLRLSHIHERLDRIGWVAVGAAAAVTFLTLVAYLGFAHSGPHGGYPGWLQYMIYGSVACGTVGPAIAAGLAGIRFQGDFERFAHRSHKTLGQLERILQRLDAITRRSRTCQPFCAGPQAPLIEDLVDLALEVQTTYEDDLEDWRFVYAARPIPGL
jgi:hypothetical protein